MGYSADGRPHFEPLRCWFCGRTYDDVGGHLVASPSPPPYAPAATWGNFTRVQICVHCVQDLHTFFVTGESKYSD
jgi:hypothetical protein